MSSSRQSSLFEFKIYCIDACSIINLFHPRGLPYPPYPSDIFEGLWKKLEQIIKNGQLISHMRVFEEISKRDDDAKKWCQKHKKIFRDIDDCQLEQIKKIKTKYQVVQDPSQAGYIIQANVLYMDYYRKTGTHKPRAG